MLCDVWGVIHNGVRPYAAAVDALRRFRARGGTVILVTNAPVPDRQVRARLDRLGIGRDSYDGIATAGDVTVAMLVDDGCPPIFSIGPGEEVAIYREAARVGPRAPNLVGLDAARVAICLGLDETGDRPEDYDGLLGRMKARDLVMICANPDIVVEVGEDLVYCAGAIAQRYAALGGPVIQTGKPHAAIYERAYAMAAAIRGPTPPRRILAIGDAIATDVAGAVREGIAAVFITAGIHRASLHGAHGDQPLDVGALQALLAATGSRPTAAMDRLAWELETT